MPDLTLMGSYSALKQIMNAVRSTEAGQYPPPRGCAAMSINPSLGKIGARHE